MTPEDAPKNPAMTPQQALFSEYEKSGLKLYRALAVGDRSLLHFLGYEIATTLLSGLPGLLGFGSRSLIYPWLFGECAARPAIGRGVVIRIPKQIHIGKGVMIDDYAALDVRGANSSIQIGDRAVIGRYTTIAAKGGTVSLSAGVNVGSYCRVATQSKVEIGASTLIAAYCYIGPGNHQPGDSKLPLIAREMEIKDGVEIGANCWIGAQTTILDGVKIGSNVIIGANSLVTNAVSDNTVVAGTPAKVIHRE